MVHFCFLLLEKSAPLPIVTVVTNMSYGLWVSNYITMQSGCILRLSFHYHQLQNDSHNNTKEGEKNATMVSWVPGCLCLLTIKEGGRKTTIKTENNWLQNKIVRKKMTSSGTGNGVMKWDFKKSNNVILVEKVPCCDRGMCERRRYWPCTPANISNISNICKPVFVYLFLCPCNLCTFCCYLGKQCFWFDCNSKLTLIQAKQFATLRFWWQCILSCAT